MKKRLSTIIAGLGIAAIAVLGLSAPAQATPSQTSQVPSLVTELSITTPSSLIQCQPTQIDWSGGTGPYTLSAGVKLPILDTYVPLRVFPMQTGNTLNWMVDLPVGTSVTFALKDSSGATSYTEAVSLQVGSAACL